MSLLLCVGIVLRVLGGVAVARGADTHEGRIGFQPDAVVYYAAATTAAREGFHTITPATATPPFVRVLAAWFVCFGSSLLSILLFNLTCFVLTSALVILPLRHLPGGLTTPIATVVVSAFALSPMLIFAASQPLKESSFTLMATAAIVSAWKIATLAISRQALSVRRSWGPLLTLIPAIYLLSGMRAYYAFLFGVCLALLFVAAVIGDRRRLATVAGLAAATFIPFSGTFALGSGTPIAPYLELVSHPSQAGQFIARARRGFATSGGNTNLAAAEGERARRARRGADAEGEPAWTSGLAMGVAVLFVPVSLLRALSIVDLPSTSQLLLADVDTLFLDLTFVAVAVLLWRESRRTGLVWPYAVFAIASAVMLAGLMGYVVTNFGTLVRLRLMLSTALWTLPFALKQIEPTTVARLHDSATH